MIDAANVIGSRPTGWWRDRAGAARRFVDQVRRAARGGRLPVPAVVVLEGHARAGVAEGDVDGVLVVHAGGSGDDAVVALVRDDAVVSLVRDGAAHAEMTVVTADRGLRARVQALGAEAVGPHWLHEKLAEPSPPRWGGPQGS